MSILSVVIAIIIFCVIVVVHEWGHYIVAKLCGVRVDEFAIGMGPAIFRKQGKETLFTVRMLPIGGFCSMGEDEDRDDPNSFRRKPVWAKMAVIVAGACMNVVLGFFVCIISFIVSGKGVTTQIVYFADDAVSPQYGLQLGDTITRVNGMKIFTSRDIIYQLTNDEDGIVDFTVKRDGETVQLDAVHFPMTTDEETGKQVLTYDFKVLSEKITITNILPYSLKATAYYARVVLMSLRDLISGKYGINDLQGPVGIVSVIGSAVESTGIDWDFLLQMAALITINIGIFNLLPIPALDGGRFVLLIVEAIRRKPMKAEVEGMIHFVGLALLMVLVIVVTFNDVKNLFVG
jgi:regulator of sigma E protease